MGGRNGEKPEKPESETMKKMGRLSGLTIIRLPKSIILLLLLTTILTALLEGCIQEKPVAEDILKRMYQKYSSISSYKATLYQREISDGKVQETRYELFVKRPDKAKIKHVPSGVVTVVNGSKIWFYNKNTGEIKAFTYNRTSQHLIDFFGFTLEMLKKYNASLSGKETIDGKDCYILSLRPSQNLERTHVLKSCGL